MWEDVIRKQRLHGLNNQDLSEGALIHHADGQQQGWNTLECRCYGEMGIC